MTPFEDIRLSVESYVVLFEELKSTLENIPSAGVSPPDFTIELWGAEVTVVNWEVISPYLATVQSIVIAISYIYFLYWLMRRIAAVIYEE